MVGKLRWSEMQLEMGVSLLCPAPPTMRSEFPRALCPVPRGGSSEICSPFMWAEGLRVWDSQAGGERSASGQVSGALESSLPKVPPVRRPVDQPSSQRREGAGELSGPARDHILKTRYERKRRVECPAQ